MERQKTQTRGVAMNPVDHPMVEEKENFRGRSPVSPWDSQQKV